MRMLGSLYGMACQWVKGAVKRDDGQGMVEYGLILALIAVVVIGALILLGDEVRDIFETITDGLGGAEPSDP